MKQFSAKFPPALYAMLKDLRESMMMSTNIAVIKHLIVKAHQELKNEQMPRM